MCGSGGERFIFSWGRVLSHVWVKCATFVIDSFGITIAMVNLLWLLLSGGLNVEL